MKNYEIAFNRSLNEKRNNRLKAAMARLRTAGMDEATSAAMSEAIQASSEGLRDVNAEIGGSLDGCGRRARRQVAAIKLREDLHAGFDGYDAIAGREQVVSNSASKALIGLGVFLSNVIGAFKADSAGSKAMPVSQKTHARQAAAEAAIVP